MIDGLLTYAAQDQLIVLGVLGGLILLVVVLMAVAVLRANRAARLADEAPPPEPVPEAELEIVPETADEKAAAKREAARSLRRLMREGAGATSEAFSRNPYLMPWVLRVGIGKAADDGGVLAALEEIRPAVGDPARDPVSWHFYEGGVVIDVREPEAWAEVLTYTARKRPSLPVDGIVLTVPVAALREPRQAASFGAEAYTLLWRAQRLLGFAVPVYVVVTGTEELPGFRAFEDMLPPGNHDTMVGWSYPYAMDAAFNQEHVAEAIATVEQGLLAAALEAFGSVVDAEHGAGMLQVRQDLAELEKPLGGFLGTAFRRTAFQESNYFRGIYFVTRPDPRRPASFARDLLERKVFAENGLSKMLRGAARSRLVQRYAWPAAAALAVIAGVGTIAGSMARIEAYEATAEPILRATAADVQAATVRRTEDVDPGADADAAVRYLRNATSLAESEPLVFVPLTWFVDDPYGVEAAMSAGWRRIALRGIKSQIETRLQGLTDSGDTDLAPDIAFRRYLMRVAEAEGFAIAFNEIGRGGRATGTRPMLEYALGVEVPPATVDKLESWGAIGDDALPIDDPSLRIALDDYAEAAHSTFRQLADSYFRMLAAGGQAGVRLQLVAQELNLLAAGARAGEAAVAGFVEVDAGLQEASALLISGQPSWLGADGPVIPSEMQLLMDAASVSSLLGPRATRDAAKIAEQRYREVSDRLGAIESVIGPLATREADASATLTPRAEDLSALLERWMNRRFMVQAAPAQTVAASSAGIGTGAYGWDSQILERVPPLFEDYLLFEAKELREAPQELRAAMRSAARESLRDAVGRVLDAAATGVDADVVAATRSLTQLRQYANSLRQAVPVLEQAIQTYRQIGMGQPADMLRDRVAGLASAIIRRVDRMVEEDRLYRADERYLNTWGGAPMDPSGLMGQRDMQALRQHMTQARMEMAVLARETAAPMLEVLSRPLLQTPSAMAVATKWLNVIAELDAYDGQRPNSSLAQLERFIAETAPTITDANCLAEPTAPGPAGDFFSARLEGLKTDIRERCVELIDEKLIAAYGAVQSFFDQTLAGRTPFLATRASMGSADPADVRAFYDLYDRYAEILSTAVPEAAAVRAEWREPARFLETMEDARALLMHVADPQPNARLVVEPTVRVNRDRERGGNAIIEWTLQMGERDLSTFDSADTVAWYRDETAAVALRWAKDGRVVPVRPLGPAAAGASDLTARFEASGPWALHSLVRALRAPERDRADGAPQDVPLLRLEIVTAEVGTPHDREAASARAAAATDGGSGGPTPLAEGLTRLGAAAVAATEEADPDRMTRVYMALKLMRESERDGEAVVEAVPFPPLPGRAAPVPQVGYALSRAATPEPRGTGLFGGLPSYPGGAPGAVGMPAGVDREVFGLPAASDLFQAPVPR